MKMNVAELRNAVRGHNAIVDDRGTQRMPDGSLVSKARLADLTRYLSVLNAPKAAPIPITHNAGRQILDLPSNRLIGRYRRKQRKYAKRRPSPNNIKLMDHYADAAAALEQAA